MNIEQLIQHALKHKMPLRTRDGRKALPVADFRDAFVAMGANSDAVCWSIQAVVTTADWVQVVSYMANGNRPFSGDNSKLDIVGPWLEFTNWQALRPEVQYLAMDKTGRWKGFSTRPLANPNSGYWSDQQPQFGVSGVAGLPELPPEQWGYSLIERPSEV